MNIRTFLINFLVAVILLCGTGLYFLSIVPAGATSQVPATVVSRSTRSSATGTNSILVCELEDGATVIVQAPIQASVVNGNQVVLTSYERYLFARKFNFLAKLNNNASSN